MDWKQIGALVGRSKSKREELEAALAGLDIATLQMDLDALRQERRVALAGGEDVAGINARIAAKQEEIERAEIHREQLEERIRLLADEAAEEARRKDYERAQALGDKAVTALRRMPDDLVAPWLAFIEMQATANDAIATANANLPRGREPIALPEVVVRGLPAEEREIVKEETFERWCFDGDPGRAVGEPNEHLIIPDEGDGKAGWLVRETGPDNKIRVAKVRFVRQHIREARPEFRPLPVCAVVTLPGLHPGQPEVLWRPIGGPPAQMLAEVKLAREDLKLPMKDPRQPRGEFTRTLSAPRETE